MPVAVTLDPGATPTLRAAAWGGNVGITMACKSWMAVSRLMASCAVAEIVPPSVYRMLLALRIVRSAGEIRGVVQWLE